MVGSFEEGQPFLADKLRKCQAGKPDVRVVIGIDFLVATVPRWTKSCLIP